MLDFRFLTDDEVIGENRLDIFKKYGRNAIATDFSVILGCVASLMMESIIGESNKCVTGIWYTGVCTTDNYFRCIDYFGHPTIGNGLDRSIGARPAIKYSQIKGMLKSKQIRSDGILEVEYGEYPQMIVNEDLSKYLENIYHNGCIGITGKTYTTDSVNFDDYEVEFKSKSHIEYEVGGNKYIRIIVDYNGEGERKSDGTEFVEDEICWIKVEPVKWLVDEKTDIALSKKILFAGVQYCSNSNSQKNFEQLNIKKYMDTYFSNDIVPSVISREKVQYLNQNPYNFDFTEVSEEEIIKGAVESNIAVFLHGRSSEGKSARVKQIDPDSEIIYLRNATPDSLNGKSVFNSETNEMIDIPPTWYKKVVDKCASEPDKIHIIFFDEITNALPSIQGMAFNIVLNGEVNGKWKLPENARIVAAGNDLEESKAANEMAEPLFNRFAHVYINTTVDSWLKWASTPDEEYERLDYTPTEKHPKIHPAIYAYIAYKSYSKQDVLRTPYNGKTPNADPRKWEMSSKVLYKTNKPEMLRALIGEDLTRDFAMFCSRQVLSVEDVINGNYTESDLDMDVSEKFNTAVGLSSVDEENIEVVRNFVMKLGPEICATFDTLWVHGDESRLEKIAEIKLSERTK